MSPAALEESGRSADRARPAALKLLFFLQSIHYNRVFESVLRVMLERGHQVCVALDHQKGGVGQTHLFSMLGHQHPGFGFQQLPVRNDLWLIPATAIRRRLDHLRSLEPGSAGISPFDDRPPVGLRVLLWLPPFRWAFGRRLLGALLRRLEAGMPIPRSVSSFIEGQAPDVVLVSPLVEFGSAQGDYLRTAEKAAIPTVLLLASGDALTSKSAIRDVPTLTVAWNETQVEEAVRLHHLPQERIVAVDFVPRGGREAPGALDAVEAIERAAPTDVVARREGRLLRPLLWLLTPLLAILLPLLRPRATGRSVAKSVRGAVKRTQRRIREARARAAGRKKETARAAKDEERAKALAAKQAKEAEKARAHAAKEAEKARAEAAKREQRARAEAAKRKQKAQAEAAKREEKARAEAAKQAEKAKAEREEKARAEAAEQGGGRGDEE